MISPYLKRPLRSLEEIATQRPAAVISLSRQMRGDPAMPSDEPGPEVEPPVTRVTER